MKDTPRILASLSEEERRHIASWAIKTARTEQWTGQQVVRLASIPPRDENLAVIIAQATDEFDHSRLYAEFALFFELREWCEGYAFARGNFNAAPFTSILRRLDATPVIYGDRRNMIHFHVGLFCLDLAGLMTVNVYDESPFKELQDIALKIRADEGRHVQFGRDYLLGALDSSKHYGDEVRRAVAEMLPEVDLFFGGDDSPVQRTLQKVGIRTRPNAELKEKFRTKLTALLRLE